ncbi:unnamed protein product [Rotaria socialis]
MVLGSNQVIENVLTHQHSSNAEPREVGDVARQPRKKKGNSKSINTTTSESINGTNKRTSIAYSNVWKYAVRDSNPNFAICSLCKEHRRISTNNGSTSTLRKHLIIKHNLKELTLSTGKISNVRDQIDPIRKQQLRKLAIDCIIRDSRTFNDFQKSGIKRLLHELVPALSHSLITTRKFQEASGSNMKFIFFPSTRFETIYIQHLRFAHN